MLLAKYGWARRPIDQFTTPKHSQRLDGRWLGNLFVLRWLRRNCHGQSRRISGRHIREVECTERVLAPLYSNERRRDALLFDADVDHRVDGSRGSCAEGGLQSATGNRVCNIGVVHRVTGLLKHLYNRVAPTEFTWHETMLIGV